MAHEYSVKIHDYLTLKIEAAQKKKKKAKSLKDSENEQFYNGQLEELFSVKKNLIQPQNIPCMKSGSQISVFSTLCHHTFIKNLVPITIG